MSNDAIEQIVRRACAAQPAWNQRGITARSALLRPAAISLSSACAVWQLDRLLDIMPEKTPLPGPTGESNVLHWAGRGLTALCYEDALLDETALSLMLFSALATGNVVLIQDTHPLACELTQALHRSGIPNDIVQPVNWPLETMSKIIEFSVYLLCGSAAQLQNLNQQLATRDGSLPQLIGETDLQQYSTLISHDFPWRLVTETTVTNNTTAVGGNASLLGLGSEQLA